MTLFARRVAKNGRDLLVVGGKAGLRAENGCAVLRVASRVVGGVHAARGWRIEGVGRTARRRRRQRQSRRRGGRRSGIGLRRARRRTADRGGVVRPACGEGERCKHNDCAHAQGRERESVHSSVQVPAESTDDGLPGKAGRRWKRSLKSNEELIVKRLTRKRNTLKYFLSESH